MLFKNSIILAHKESTRLAQSPLRWKKPKEGVYKINWDAATKSADGKIGIGVIARDYKGQVLGTLKAPRQFE